MYIYMYLYIYIYIYIYICIYIYTYCVGRPERARPWCSTPDRGQGKGVTLATGVFVLDVCFTCFIYYNLRHTSKAQIFYFFLAGRRE